MEFFIHQVPTTIKGVEGVYNLWFVFLSFIMATLAARVALLILQATHNEDSQSRIRSCLLGAFVMGIGIWSMHFTGMLALKMDMEHTYHLGLTILSLGLAIGFSFFVFLKITQQHLSFKKVLISAPLLGVGVALMHYTGMAAMQMDGEIRYLPFYFFLSIVIAVVASGAAMLLMRYTLYSNSYKESLNTLISLIIAVAICGMHYTGMEATVFLPSATCRFISQQDSHILVGIISIGTLFIFSVGVYLVMRGFLTVSTVKENVFSGPGFIVVNLLIILVGATVISLLYIQAQQNYNIVKQSLLEQQRYKAQHVLKKFQTFFQKTYNNLCVISILPYVQQKQRFENLSKEEKKTLQTLSTFFLEETSAMSVKIVYALEGESTYSIFNIKENKLEENSELISTLKDIFKKSLPSVSSSEQERVSLPVFSKEVSYSSNKDGQEKNLIYYLPFPSQSSPLTGIVFTLFPFSVLQYLLGYEDAVLINSQEEIFIMPFTVSSTIKNSMNWIYKSQSNPDLFYSEVLNIDTQGINPAWKLWVGADVSVFNNSVELRNLSHFHISSYCIVTIITLVLLSLFNLMRRYYLREQKELREAKEAAELSTRMQSEFLSNISHELRTPLHAIINYAALGLKSLPSPVSEKLEKYLNNISHAASRLSSLLNNLLDLAKMEAKKMNFHFQKNNMKQVLEQVFNELDSLIIQKNLTWEIRYLGPENFVFDKDKIIQVLINLLSNAIKFSPASSFLLVTVEETPDPTLGPGLKCSIEDQGKGIPVNEIEFIFEKFTQSSHTKTGAGGTGLGLAICKDIISYHKGKIWAENRVQGGAAFIFFIPFSLSREQG